MIIKIAIAEVGKASVGQRLLIAKKEEEDKVVHVSRPMQPIAEKLKSPIRIIE